MNTVKIVLFSLVSMWPLAMFGQRTGARVIADKAHILNDIDTAIVLSKAGYDIYYLMESTDSILSDSFLMIAPEKLKAFQCENCHLQSLPNGFKNFKNLDYFHANWYLYGDYDTIVRNSELTRQALALTSLTALEIHGIPIPAGTTIASKGLKYLSLTDCDLDVFPISITDLSELEALMLGCNNLKAIPAEIGQLKQLKKLRLDGGACGGNPIETVSDNIGTLQALEYIDFSYAKLNTLPASLVALPNLKILDLHYAGLRRLPEFPENCRIENFNMSTDSTFEGFSASFANLNLSKLRIDVYLPKASVVKSSPVVYNLKDSIESFDLSLRGKPFNTEVTGPDVLIHKILGVWELEKASDNSMHLDLVTGIEEKDFRYLRIGGLSTYLVDTLTHHLDKDFYKKGPESGDIMLGNFSIAEQTVFGVVKHYEGRSYSKAYDGLPFWYDIDYNPEKNILKITNEKGVIYTMKRMQ